MRAHAYILASRPFGAIHVGAAVDLRRRAEEHRSGTVPGHARLYGIDRLVWFEEHPSLREAAASARRLARWRRAWKDALIMGTNPEWRDLSSRIP